MFNIKCYKQESLREYATKESKWQGLGKVIIITRFPFHWELRIFLLMGQIIQVLFLGPAETSTSCQMTSSLNTYQSVWVPLTSMSVAREILVPKENTASKMANLL